MPAMSTRPTHTTCLLPAMSTRPTHTNSYNTLNVITHKSNTHKEQSTDPGHRRGEQKQQTQRDHSDNRHTGQHQPTPPAAPRLPLQYRNRKTVTRRSNRTRYPLRHGRRRCRRICQPSPTSPNPSYAPLHPTAPPHTRPTPKRYSRLVADAAIRFSEAPPHRGLQCVPAENATQGRRQPRYLARHLGWHSSRQGERFRPRRSR